jgi:dTDP-4-dehydrorhamnose 3,5-epimerase
MIERSRVHGALLLQPSVMEDERGSFVEIFQTRELVAHGATGSFVRSALSANTRAHTLRGLHFQRAPHHDAKLVACIAGAVFDVVVDIRPDSPSFGQWEAFELTAANRRAVYLPEGVAHGFQTLADHTTVLYHIGAYYVPEAGAGIRWDDPRLGIQWPHPPTVISDRDAAFGFLQW